MSQSLILAKSFLNQIVEVVVDRPLNSVHPKWKFKYPVNYGYIPGIFAPDGEELDAYVLKVDQSLEKFVGRVVAIIHRINDGDDKLIVISDGETITDSEITQLTEFQEKWFNKEIMKKVFLCTPHKLGDLNYQLISRIKNLGFEVICAVTHSPQNIPFDQMFENNVALIKQSDIFVAVLKDYGKDLTAEVGMAYAWNMPRIGIDYTALDTDVMSYYALEKIIKPEELEETLKTYL